MTESKLKRGVCGQCGRGYRVPEGGRVHRCKECGGEISVALVAEQAPRGEAVAELKTCAACRAVLPKASQFCPECGAAAGDGPRGKHDASAGTRAERLMAAKDIRQAERTVKFVRWMFRGFALCFLLFTSGSLALLPSAELGAESLLMVALFATLSVLALAGSHLAAVHPFPCSIALASLFSLDVVFLLLDGQMPLVRLGVMVTLWLAVIPTVRVGRLLRAHPDLFVTRRLMGDTTSHGAGHAAQRARAARKGWKRVAVSSALVFGASSLAAIGAWSKRPPQPRDTLAEFVEAWNSSSPEQVAGFFTASKRVRERGRLAGLSGQHGWPRWPRISMPESSVDAYDALSFKHAFALDDGDTLSSSWILKENRWVLRALLLPLPSLEGLVSAFSSAWKSGDPAALARLCRESSHDKMRASFAKLQEQRGWTTGFPALGEHELRAQTEKSVEIWFESEVGRLRTSWRLDNEGRWKLSFVEPPRD